VGPQSDLALFKEKAGAVQVVITEITDLAEAFSYAIELTTKQGGKAMAAFGWHDQNAALAAACSQAGVTLVRENLREHAATLHTALTLCASCGSHLEEAYPRLLAQEPGLSVKAQQFARKVMDFSSFMTDVLKVKPDEFRGRGRKVAYHAPCHLCQGLGVTAAPRDLLATAGLEYLPARDEDVCWGMAGSYSVDFPELSAELLKKKLDAVEETGAELLVTDCPGCVLQLKGGMDKRGAKVEVKHIAEVVAEAGKAPRPH
jgi:Fe-S oxidoreductase